MKVSRALANWLIRSPGRYGITCCEFAPVPGAYIVRLTRRLPGDDRDLVLSQHVHGSRKDALWAAAKWIERDAGASG